ncbi:hypothetical protein ERJ75_000559200 [Trypanosoma vivax]|nr:hypothetical protein ERJ75_000559200 [Trypanosoma vivax]
MGVVGARGRGEGVRGGVGEWQPAMLRRCFGSANEVFASNGAGDSAFVDTACGAMADSADKHPVLEASVGKMCALAAAVKKEFGTAVEEGGWPKPLDEIVEGENISKALATARTARTLAGDSAREDRDTLEAIALAIEGLAALNATREVVSVAQGQLTLHAQAYVNKSTTVCSSFTATKRKQFVRCGNSFASYEPRELRRCTEVQRKRLTWKRRTCSYTQSSGKMGQEALVDRAGNCARHANAASQTKHSTADRETLKVMSHAGRGK